jgi:aspartyl-tRNA(Asn)/glutamyl-tRNA(Gln) amidotransferase subunit C
MIDRETVLHVALLARLEFTDEEVEQLTVELASVLDHIETIAGLDLDGVAPTTHVIAIENTLRADEPQPSLPVARVLADAPAVAEGGFAVPSPQA